MYESLLILLGPVSGGWLTWAFTVDFDGSGMAGWVGPAKVCAGAYRAAKPTSPDGQSEDLAGSSWACATCGARGDSGARQQCKRIMHPTPRWGPAG
jgi:hypothetical protein